MTYVYLKTQNFSGTDLSLDTIPLKVNTVGISVSKDIPSLPVPFTTFITGESERVALDLALGTKSINLGGTITDTVIKKTIAGVATSRTFTAHEVAQMIASSVDSTSLARNQAVAELVILMPSFVGNDYETRSGVDVNNRDTGVLVPLTFHSRGGANLLENELVPLPLNQFPDSSTDEGLVGFIRSFTCNFEAESFDLTFTMDFDIARVFP
ncbi:hypothetical protein OAA37_00105 [bacterium]|nr:hypothetical protein [bacterium]MDA8843599.1 hypothetical protein [Euryarchaeota archaeon]MDB4347855.1 hypothetical protein [bacterium]